MGKYTDLSGPIYPGMWSYNVLPSLRGLLPGFAVEQLTTVEQHGVELFRFELTNVTGSYLETAGHMLAGQPALSDLEPDRFICPAVVCRVPAKGPDELIRGEELEAHCPPVNQGEALLVDCGWGRQWRSAGYVTHGPAFHRDCLPWLLAQPISILGVDVPCIESARSRPDGDEATGSMLIPLFEKGILLLAPLINLYTIDSPRGELFALPLKVEGASGAPCRAVFREG